MGLARLERAAEIKPRVQQVPPVRRNQRFLLTLKEIVSVKGHSTDDSSSGSGF